MKSIGTKIENNEVLSLNKRINVYNKPKFVYIPLIVGNDTNITVTVKKGDYVFKGKEVGHRKGDFSLPIHSSVSGTVIDFVNKPIYNRKKVKCVLIENDFKENIEKKYQEVKKINEYSKKEFLNILKSCGIRGMGGADFPTYIKYKQENIKNLIINAVESEPYITADQALIKIKCEEILETIDAILEICNIDNAYIAIKNNTLKKILENYIGTYPNIKIKEVPDLYPIGWEKNLVKVIINKDYDKLPSEVNTIVSNVSTIYAIYKALSVRKPLIERIVTFTGDMFKKPQNVLVKIGTPVDEVIKHIGGFKRSKNINFIAGGPMMGKSLSSDELIVTSNLNCVLVLKDKDLGKKLECLRCGKCVSICPAKLSPVLIRDNVNNKKELKNLFPNKCVECGLCSYICPSKISLREHVIKAKDVLDEKI